MSVELVFLHTHRMKSFHADRPMFVASVADISGVRALRLEGAHLILVHEGANADDVDEASMVESAIQTQIALPITLASDSVNERNAPRVFVTDGTDVE